MVDPTSMLWPQRSTLVEDETLICLDEYQSWTKLTDRNEQEGIDGLGFVLLGLFGEVGSWLSELKKKQRDKDSYLAYHESVAATNFISWPPCVSKRGVKVARGKGEAGWPCPLVAYCPEQQPKVAQYRNPHQAASSLYRRSARDKPSPSAPLRS